MKIQIVLNFGEEYKFWKKNLNVVRKHVLFINGMFNYISAGN